MFKFQPNVFFSLLVGGLGTIFFSICAVVAACIEYILKKLGVLKGQRGPLSMSIKYWWSNWIFWSHQIKLDVSGPGAAKAKQNRGVIFVSNHQSALDIPVASSVLSKLTTFLAKKELAWIPIFGWAASAIGVLFIDRSKGTKNKSLEKLNRQLREGLSIVIFPEGTRSKDGHLLKFKRGAFVMAIEAQIPIVPMVILDSRLLMPKYRLSIGSGVIHVWIGDDISTKGLKVEDRYELTDKIEHIMAKQLENFDKNRKND